VRFERSRKLNFFSSPFWFTGNQCKFVAVFFSPSVNYIETEIEIIRNIYGKIPADRLLISKGFLGLIILFPISFDLRINDNDTDKTGISDDRLFTIIRGDIKIVH
jgi:hypothetical protein